MSANSVARYKNTLNAAFNWYIKENGLEITSPFAGLLIKGAGSSKVDRLPLQDAHIKLLEPAMMRFAQSLPMSGSMALAQP